MARTVFPSATTIGVKGDTLTESNLLASAKLLMRMEGVIPIRAWTLQFNNDTNQFTLIGVWIAGGYVFDFGLAPGHTCPSLTLPGDVYGNYYVSWVNTFTAGLCTGFYFAWTYEVKTLLPNAAPFARITQSSSGAKTYTLFLAQPKTTVTAPSWD